MSTRRSVAEILGQGVVFEAHEAVAVVQQLLDHGIATGELAPPFGPPTADTVEIGTDGSVCCRHCGVTPAVSEIGQLLDDMLPRASFARVPGGLRYAIARARQEVDAPPFDSVAQLSAVLARYGKGDNREVVRELATRVSLESEARAPDVDSDIIRSAAPAIVYQPIHRSRSSRATWAAVGAVAAAISFSATYVGVLHHRIHSLSGQTNPGGVTANARGTADGPFSENNGADSVVREEGLRSARGTRPAAAVPAAPVAEGPMFSPAFASSGTALFYHTGRSSDARSALAERPLDDGLEVMTILDDGARNFHVQPSPDGSRIAFDSDRDGERGVYIAARDGSDVHRVSGPGYAAVPTWSPDGQRLAFVRGEPGRSRVWNLWLLTLATSETRRLTNFRSGQTWSASWFPDGRRVAYTHEDRLAILNLIDDVTRTIESPVRGRLVRTAAVSPNGRYIIFQVSRSGAWIVDLSDGSMRCVLTDPTAEEFSWSPDGRRVAFHSRRDGHWGIFLMAPEV